ncbi:unnamed protein product [Citrullus colocynthis]|uniref:Uncharacterized protein n=1 Tax=Citrullus colocynthis TaxID=252529 RepID=A0ABP0Z549_9ROSI
MGTYRGRIEGKFEATMKEAKRRGGVPMVVEAKREVPDPNSDCSLPNTLLYRERIQCILGDLLLLLSYFTENLLLLSIQFTHKEMKEFKGFNLILLHTEDLGLMVIFAIDGDLVKFQ